MPIIALDQEPEQPQDFMRKLRATHPIYSEKPWANGSLPELQGQRRITQAGKPKDFVFFLQGTH